MKQGEKIWKIIIISLYKIMVQKLYFRIEKTSHILDLLINWYLQKIPKIILKIFPNDAASIQN